VDIVIVDVWNIVTTIKKGGTGKRLGNTSSECVIKERF